MKTALILLAGFCAIGAISVAAYCLLRAADLLQDPYEDADENRG